MPDLDLEPGEYREKEPILKRGWWVGLLTLVGIVLFAAFVLRPLYGLWADLSDPFFNWLLGIH